jgi:acyl carrier protein
MNQDIKQRVQTLVAKILGEFQHEESSRGDSLLGEAGGVDSTKTLELIIEVEREFAVFIKDDEINPDNLGSTENLVRFISSKKT